MRRISKYDILYGIAAAILVVFGMAVWPVVKGWFGW